MTRSLVFASLLCFSAAAWPQDEIRYLPGSALQEKGVYDDIPGIFGEHVVLHEEGRVTGEASFVFDQPYERVIDVLDRHLDRLQSLSFGRTRATPKGGELHSEAAPERKERLRSRAPDEAAPMRPMSLPIRETLIQIAPYNSATDPAKFSTLSMRVADGRTLLGRPSTVFTLVRVDHTRSRLRTFHLGIPLPMKGNTQVSLLTDTEIGFVKAFEEALGAPAVTLVFSDTMGDPLRFADVTSKISARSYFPQK
jgi:hypothetical protein